ncbi:MAG TPA: hypothetical protein VMF90_16400 [Rhizobiaceae bacterium]|nr:hypothetical protein [Rhizobiaceae bacterium]
MRLESALDLQNRVFAQVFDFQPLPVASDRNVTGRESLVDPTVFEIDPAIARARKNDRQQTTEEIALGVSEGAGGDDVRLAVLVQDRDKMRSAMIDEIVELARGEADVIYIGPQEASGFWTLERIDPILIGASIFPLTRPGAGTLGCFCRDAAGGGDGILSNNHVLADVNVTPIGGRVTQPGGFDGGAASADDIAELTRFVPIIFDGPPNLVDAAFATLIDHGRAIDMHGLFNDARPPALQKTIVPGPGVPAARGLNVHKTGRKTCFTSGRVLATNVDNYWVKFKNERRGRFDDQITIETVNQSTPFSRTGDSGSLIVDDEGNPVALLFAGSPSGGAGDVGVTGASPIGNVLSQLGIVLI